MHCFNNNNNKKKKLKVNLIVFQKENAEVFEKKT